MFIEIKNYLTQLTELVERLEKVAKILRSPEETKELPAAASDEIQPEIKKEMPEPVIDQPVKKGRGRPAKVKTIEKSFLDDADEKEESENLDWLNNKEIAPEISLDTVMQACRNAAKAKSAEFVTSIFKKHFNVKNVRDIPAHDYSKLLNLLNG